MEMLLSAEGMHTCGHACMRSFVSQSKQAERPMHVRSRAIKVVRLFDASNARSPSGLPLSPPPPPPGDATLPSSCVSRPHSTHPVEHLSTQQKSPKRARPMRACVTRARPTCAFNARRTAPKPAANCGFPSRTHTRHWHC
eukprot:196078-Chlamydomonas_euryale.AAC.1